jgi:CDGSH-type Zn-finger protein
MSDAKKVTCKPNGPYLLKGPLEIEDPTGTVHTVEDGKTVALCRCGASTKKPYCDGTHSKIGFAAAEAAVAKE